MEGKVFDPLLKDKAYRTEEELRVMYRCAKVEVDALKRAEQASAGPSQA